MKYLSILIFAEVCCVAASAHVYKTNFPLTENPISEHGAWASGLATGLEWTDVQTTTNQAYSTRTSNVEPPYADSMADIQWGSFGANQSACVIAYINTAESPDAEIEIRLNMTITANNATGYEFNWSVSASNSYQNISRWNGPLNNFTLLSSLSGAGGVNNGDLLCASNFNGTLVMSRNGVIDNSTSDTTYTNGSPGVAFDCNSTCAAGDIYTGFSSFSGSDGNATTHSWGTSHTWATGHSWGTSHIWNTAGDWQ